MIIEPVMTNCGVVLPDAGYLDGLKEICHTHGAMFAYDEVKTGFTVAWGGAIEAFGVSPTWWRSRRRSARACRAARSAAPRTRCAW